MQILDKCEDDNFFTASTDPVKFPTDTYYPPGVKKCMYNDVHTFVFVYILTKSFHVFHVIGTLCARNIYEQSCFYSGESGSPLMIRLSRLIHNSNGPLIRTFAVVLGRKMKISTDLS